MLWRTNKKNSSYPVIAAFFKEKGLVRQHLTSFNDFVEHGLQEIVDEVGEIPIEAGDQPYKIKLGKVEVLKPRVVEIDGSQREITPMEARLRNLSYTAPLMLTVTEEVNGHLGESRSIFIGDLPIMVKSECCPLSRMTSDELIKIGEDPDDPGGYFIINGSERVLVAQEDLAPNKIICDVERSGTHLIYRAKVFSSTVGLRAKIEVKMQSDQSLRVSIPGVPAEIPFVILMRALGIRTDREIAEMVSPYEEVQAELLPSFQEASQVTTPESAILYIGNRVAYGQAEEYRIRKANFTLDNNLLPHLGKKPEDRLNKAYFLAEMAERIIEVKLGWRNVDDKDHLANKRVRFAGSLMAELFRTVFGSLCKDIKYQLEKMSIKRRPIIERISVAVRPSILTQKFQHALATGNWGHGKVGVSQLLDRTNWLSTLSHLRRVQSPLSRLQPNFEARDLHPTQWGRYCPMETPEGPNCGLVKNLALMAVVSTEVDPKGIKEHLTKLGMVSREKVGGEARKKFAKVFLNGQLIGYVEDAELLVNEFRTLRRRGIINPEVSIACKSVKGPMNSIRKEVIINSDEGRILRPLIIVENGVPRLKPEHLEKLEKEEMTWSDLVKQGVIEYLDPDEEENAYIALRSEDITPEHTHLEIDPYVTFGVCTAIIPYAEHNQSPRNVYEAAMAKQSLGISAINQLDRPDSHSHILHYPQIPLVVTDALDFINYYDHPSGQNFIVAVLSYGGYNMEDAVVLNRSSIDRGLARSTFYRVYEVEAKQYPGGLKDAFEIPKPEVAGYREDKYYRLLESDGIASLESKVEGNDVIIGRTSPPRFLEEYKGMEIGGPIRKDTSISLRPSESGIVSDALITTTSEGNKLVKVKVRDIRIPEIGDKFASRHGQKGVIGLLLPQEDMPFTEEGIVPDILINPHAIPSRMTLGQFIESIAGKLACMKGELIDGTPFRGAKEGLREELLKVDLQYSGREVLYDGITGEKFKTEIFIGVVYYQKLHHMAADKIHVRAKGQVQVLTRQPTEGKSRGGGLRFGEMERDSLIAYGASSLLRDRLLEGSDKTTIYVCNNCGFLAYYDRIRGKYVCRICEEKADVYPVVVSYAFKLLLQELMSLCIAPRLRLSEI